MGSQKKQSSCMNVILVLLIILDLISLAIVFGRMSAYSAQNIQRNIFLTESRANTSLKVEQNTHNSLGEGSGNIKVSGKDSELKVYDENTRWSTETKIDIFRLSYKNEDGQITVNGKLTNKEKLFAPGTKNRYTFTVENSGNHTLSYTMEVEAFFEGTDEKIPIKASMWDYTDKYLLGSKTKKEDVLQLNQIKEKSALGSERYARYTLEWEWPFERGDDSFDTMLGNLAVEKDLTLTIVIKTTAMWDNDPKHINYGEKSPKTGQERAKIYCLVAILVISVIVALRGIFIGFIWSDRDEDEDEEDVDEEEKEID